MCKENVSIIEMHSLTTNCVKKACNVSTVWLGKALGVSTVFRVLQMSLRNGQKLVSD